MTTAATADTPARFAAVLRKLGACNDARAWAAGLDYNTAWATCQNPDWLLWLLNTEQAVSPQANELLCCAFAREVLHLNADPRVLACIETREAWARGEATDAARAAARAAARGEATDAARAAARSAARSAAGDAAGDAAGAAARAAAGAAAWAAAGGAAGDVAGGAAGDVAGPAAGDAAWDVAWDVAWAKQCNIIRRMLPMPALS